MTLYMLFAAAAILIYTGTAFVAVVSGVDDVHAAVTPNKSPAVVAVESARPQAAGETLFQELGCIEPNGDSQ
jgi:hypothetical protein